MCKQTYNNLFIISELIKFYLKKTPQSKQLYKIMNFIHFITNLNSYWKKNFFLDFLLKQS